MSKDQWIADLERILEAYAAEEINRETAAGQLAELGLDAPEIKEALDDVFA